MARDFSPLDEELGLTPGCLTPSLQHSLTRLGTWLPFAPAAAMLTHFTGVSVSASSARRQTEAAGAAYLAVQAAELRRLERDLPPPPAGPAVQQLTVDGVFVPLVGGQWAEVKTLTIGTVVPPCPTPRRPAAAPRTTELSYFACLADVERFSWRATVETHRRGVETAGTVCAVSDGALWCQQFADLHRPDAVRILDFPHAAQYLTEAAAAVWEPGSDAARAWSRQQARRLLSEGPAPVLAALRALEQAEAVTTALGYLGSRVEQTQYPAFRAAGYPIGSGCGESANKLVVEARLKGSGMHWSRAQVDPMLALRTVACNDRWDEARPDIQRHLRAQQVARARARRQQRQTAAARGPRERTPDAVLAPAASMPVAPAPVMPPSMVPYDQPASTARPRPAATHPWRHAHIGRGLPFQRRAET